MDTNTTIKGKFSFCGSIEDFKSYVKKKYEEEQSLNYLSSLPEDKQEHPNL